MSNYSQGVCEDGAAILCDGERITVDEIVSRLNRLVELETELTERNRAYGDLVKQLEHSSNTWQAEVEKLRSALKQIAGRENQGNPYDPNDHPDPYSMIEEAKEVLHQEVSDGRRI